MHGKLLILFLFIINIPDVDAQKINTITSIQFTENNNLNVIFLNKLIEVKAGFPLDSLEIFKDITMLKRLPAVTQATFVVQPEVDGYKLTYILEENHTLIPQANFYTTNNEEFAYRLGLSEYNFLGRAIEVGAFYQKDIYDSYGFRFRAPFLFSNKIGIGISVMDLNTLEPVFFNSSTANYKYTNTSIALNALYKLNLKNRIELGISLFTEKYKLISDVTTSEAIQNLDVNKFAYKMIYQYDGINYFFQYLSGFKNQLNLQYVVSSNNILPDFLIGFNDLLYFKRIGERGNWASRLRVGLASNINTAFAPFAVDNNLNIRGVGNTIDRGTAALVLNTEYRYTFYEKKWFVVQSNFFVDAGTWRNPGGNFGDFGEKQNLRVYPGIGLRFIHKRIFNAIFRIDYGYGITPNSKKGLVFGIGQYF